MCYPSKAGDSISRKSSECQQVLWPFFILIFLSSGFQHLSLLSVSCCSFLYRQYWLCKMKPSLNWYPTSHFSQDSHFSIILASFRFTSTWHFFMFGCVASWVSEANLTISIIPSDCTRWNSLTQLTSCFASYFSPIAVINSTKFYLGFTYPWKECVFLKWKQDTAPLKLTFSMIYNQWFCVSVSDSK